MTNEFNLRPLEFLGTSTWPLFIVLYTNMAAVTSVKTIYDIGLSKYNLLKDSISRHPIDFHRKSRYDFR